MKVEERAAQIWSVLQIAAENRQVLTYDQVARVTGLPKMGLGQPGADSAVLYEEATAAPYELSGSA